MRLLALVTLVGCGRLGFADQPPADGAPPSTDLVVDVATDRLAGGPTIASLADLPPSTQGLSLREALTIAANRAGPDLVRFSFATPTTITIASELVVAADTALDATGNTVTIAPAAAYTGALLHVTGDNAAISSLALSGGADAVRAVSVANLTLKSLSLATPTGDGIHLESCTHCEIDDCRVDHAAGEPVLVRTSSDLFVRRAFVALASKAGTLHGIEVESSSQIHILDSIIDPGTAWMIDLQDTTDSEITGNVIDGADTGITLFGTTARIAIFRNVVTNPAQDSIYVDASVTDTTITNNTFYNAPDITNNGVNTTEVNTLLSTNAADFVAPATYDFHLVAGSTSIDAATDVGQDMLPDSPARYLGAGPDLGAVESF